MTYYGAEKVVRYIFDLECGDTSTSKLDYEQFLKQVGYFQKKGPSVIWGGHYHYWGRHYYHTRTAHEVGHIHAEQLTSTTSCGVVYRAPEN